MKVLHVIDSLGVGGGAEHSLVHTLPLLRARGIDNHVVCLTARVGGLQEKVRSEGFPLTVLRQGNQVLQVAQLRRLIRRERPDIVHSTLIRSNILSRVACVGTNTTQLNSRVNTTYDSVRTRSLGIAPWKMRALQLLDRATAGVMTGGFHAISSPVRDETVELLGVDPDDVWLVPRGRAASSLGVWSEERRQFARRELGLAPDDLALLNVGRQDVQKAHALLVDAFTAVAAEIPTARLLIAGREGTGSAELQEALRRSSSRSRVTLLGHRTDVGDLLCAADLFVFPSHYEGLGGSLIEAMAVRCPIVATDVPAMAEVLGDGQYGRLVARGDVSGLAHEITALLSSASERAAVGAAGYQRFQSTYELEHIADRTVEMYQEVLNRQRRGPARRQDSR